MVEVSGMTISLAVTPNDTSGTGRQIRNASWVVSRLVSIATSRSGCVMSASINSAPLTGERGGTSNERRVFDVAEMVAL